MYKQDRSIHRVVIHCTAGYPNQEVKAILRYWKEKYGWKQPGYHYIIPPDGKIIQLQPETQMTNGVKGFNQNSIHIAWIGGRSLETGKYVDNRTNEQKHSLYTVIEFLKLKYGVPTVGHRDLSPDLNHDGIITQNEWIKECPLFDVKTFLESKSLFYEATRKDQ